LPSCEFGPCTDFKTEVARRGNKHRRHRYDSLVCARAVKEFCLVCRTKAALTVRRSGTHPRTYRPTMRTLPTLHLTEILILGTMTATPSALITMSVSTTRPKNSPCGTPLSSSQNKKSTATNKTQPTTTNKNCRDGDEKCTLLVARGVLLHHGRRAAWRLFAYKGTH
jgi:hypothetical protein